MVGGMLQFNGIHSSNQWVNEKLHSSMEGSQLGMPIFTISLAISGGRAQYACKIKVGIKGNKLYQGHKRSYNHMYCVGGCPYSIWKWSNDKGYNLWVLLNILREATSMEINVTKSSIRFEKVNSAQRTMIT